MSPFELLQEDVDVQALLGVDEGNLWTGRQLLTGHECCPADCRVKTAGPLSAWSGLWFWFWSQSEED